MLAPALLVLGLRRVPRRGAWLRAFLLVNVYAAAIAVVNWALGTNFFYLLHKPPTPTPVDWFGPWPWYIATGEGVALALFFLLDQALRPLRREEQGPPQATAVVTPLSPSG